MPFWNLKKHSSNFTSIWLQYLCIPLYFFSIDEKTSSQSHQATHERLHGLVPNRTEKDMREEPRHSQCRDLEKARERVENVDGGGTETIHRGS